MSMDVSYLTAEEMEAGLAEVLASPRDQGRLEAIVIRPASDERGVCETVFLSPEGGLEGDRWASTVDHLLAEGKLDPTAQQVSLMNARLLRLLAGDQERMALAGDNLVVDLDLSEANLPAGQKLAVGEALFEITDQAHTGCGKFARRFGPDAVKFVNAGDRRSLRLRGAYARVLRAGTVRVGDAVRKVE
jgi:MOSC domain-containing protein YiiM